MHVGVDATCCSNTRGYGRHARALLSAMRRLDGGNRYTFFTDSPNGDAFPPGVEVRRIGSAAPAAMAAAANGYRSLRDMWRVSRAMTKGGCDVLLFPTVYTYVPVFGRAKKIVLIHDVIAETFPQLTLPSRRARLFWETKVALGRWQADALVTVSDHSRVGIVEHFGMDPDRVFVVGEAADPVFQVLEHPQPTPALESRGIEGRERIVVYLGGFSPHKNLEMLVSAFAALARRQEFADVRLVMVGEYKKEVFHSYAGTIRRQVEELGLADRVIFTGYLADEELVVLLNLATALVLPSLLEGFGLPGVEAAACGCPVVATTASPLPQLLGEGGLFVDPSDRAGWEDAISQVLQSEDLRRRLRQAGLAAAGQLTWEAAARQMLELLRKVTAA